jgi:glycosyltransferase involved in cell wall biosynthesis
MKILIIHYAYFITGGPERYLFNVKSLLENNGHKIIIFSMRNRENETSEYSNYFASPVNNDGSWYFNGNTGLRSRLKQINRIFYSKEVEKKLTLLIEKEKPDIAYVLLYQKKLSPSVLVACKKNNIPIVSRISDFQLMCPKCTFYRNGNICEECGKSKLVSIKNKCIKNSYFSSILWYFADKYHHYKKFYDLIDAFVLTNPFMALKLKEYGYYNKNRYHVIRTCSNNNYKYIKDYAEKKKNPKICYIGNIFEHKGVDLLIESFVSLKNCDLKLVIMGNDPDNIVKNMLADNRYNLKNIEYIKHSDEENVMEILSESLFFILPVKWYENLPNALLESFSVGTPVISTNIGSIKYMINDGETGFLFENGNLNDLIQLLYKSINLPKDKYEKMQITCLNEIKTHYSYEAHYKSLINLFNQLIM